MQDSIFTKIINKQIPAYIIYEDDKTIAFLDIHPVQPGHTLVVPKAQVEYLWDLPGDYYEAVMLTTRIVARKIRDSLAVKHVGMRVVGLDVPHAHVHIIPFNEAKEFQVVRDLNEEPDHDALQVIEKLLTTEHNS